MAGRVVQRKMAMQNPYGDSMVESPYLNAGSPPVSQQGYENQAITALQNQYTNQNAMQQRDWQVDDAARADLRARNAVVTPSRRVMQQPQQQQQRSQQAQMAHQLAMLDTQSKQAENQLRLAHEQRTQLADQGFSRAKELMAGFQDPTTEVAAGPDPNEAAARAAAFGRAKDQAGQTGRAAMDGLQSYLADSGLFGSGFDASSAANVLGQTAGGVNEFTRDQMIMDTDRAGQIADRNYSGNLAKRGQNLSSIQGLMSLIGNLY